MSWYGLETELKAFCFLACYLLKLFHCTIMVTALLCVSFEEGLS